MEQRDRLIELLSSKSCWDNDCDEGGCDKCGKITISTDDIVPLADYLLANGVVVPPVKINQNVWLVFTPKFPANPEDKGKYFMRKDGVQRIIFGAKGLSIETWNMGTIPAKEIGTKLFLTEEEAERELERRKNERDFV